MEQYWNIDKSSNASDQEKSKGREYIDNIRTFAENKEKMFPWASETDRTSLCRDFLSRFEACTSTVSYRCST